MDQVSTDEEDLLMAISLSMGPKELKSISFLDSSCSVVLDEDELATTFGHILTCSAAEIEKTGHLS